MSPPLSPLAALDLAARLLTERGFALAARNERGDSFYLHRPGTEWHLRLSNHARTARQRGRRRDILTSLVIDAPRSPEQVANLVQAALRDFEANRTRREDPLGPPSRDR